MASSHHRSWRRGSLAISAALLACSGSGEWPRHGPSGTRSIAISPTSVEVEPGGTAQFTASGEGAANGVVWLVEGNVGGRAAHGTISQSGSYQAPLVSREPVTVTCQAVDDPRVSASATVSFPPIGVTVSPAEADVFLGQTQQFTVTVTGEADPRVLWFGADWTGLFTAPTWALERDVQIRATSVATGASGTATVHLKIPPPVLSAVGAPAGPGELVTITGSGLAGDVTVLFPSDGGAPIPVRGTAASGSQVVAEVPLGAATGPLSVELRMYALEPVRSNEVTFVRAPRLRVRAGRHDVAAGESTPLHVAWLGAPGPWPLTWSADVGRVEGGEYVAPSEVPSTTYAHVTACIEGTAVCDGVVLGVHPFVVQPDPALTTRGESVSLVAHASGEARGATWSLLAGGGSVSSEGVYTSSLAAEDAGLVWLSASVGGAAGAFPVGVRGAVPGLVNRVVDYVDHHAAAPVGTYTEALTVSGTRMYVVGANPVVLYGAREYLWIDVYDVADPLHPVWLGAVESASRPRWLFAAHGRLYALSPSDWSAEFESTLAVYDISGDLPVLTHREQSPRSEYGRVAFDGERVYFFEDLPPPARAVEMRVYRTDGVSPLTLEREVVLELPAGAEPRPFDSATSDGVRAYVSYREDVFPRPVRLAAYDVSVEPPVLVRDAGGGGYNLALAGPLLFADQSGATAAYDRRGDTLDLVATFPFGGIVLDSDASRVVLQTHQSGLAVVDVSDPSTPRMTTTLLSSILGGGGALVGDLLLANEGLGGVAVYDLASAGGLPPVGALGVPPYAAHTFVDMLVRPPFLYAVGPGSGTGGFVATYDLAGVPPALVSYDVLSDTGYALAATDTILAVGTPDRLELHDRSVPGDPFPVSFLPIPTMCLAAEGNQIVAGTIGTELVVVDAADPAAPAERGRLELGGQAFAIRTVAPGILAVAVSRTDRTDGWLAIVDVSDPAAPAARGSAPLGAAGWGMALEGSIAFVATPAGLATVDVADPDAPNVLARVALQGIYPYGDRYEPGTACSVAIHRGIAYVGTLYANGMVHGFDVRDPAWPRLVSLSAHSSVIMASVPALAFHDRWGFVGGVVVDAAQPRNIVLHGTAPRDLQH
jgi:hypothetical protein